MREHGTVVKYQKERCRCPACRTANSDAQRIRRANRRQAPPAYRADAWEPVDGKLPVVCWCQAAVVKVLVDDVRAGRTHSCGKPECTPLVEARSA